MHWETATVRVTIAPGTKAEIAAPDALSRAGSAKELADEARANNTQVVLVTVGILKATYGDHSAWRDKEALKRNIFDDGRAEKKEAVPRECGHAGRLHPPRGHLNDFLSGNARSLIRRPDRIEVFKYTSPARTTRWINL